MAGNILTVKPTVKIYGQNLPGIVNSARPPAVKHVVKPTEKKLLLNSPKKVTVKLTVKICAIYAYC